MFRSFVERIIDIRGLGKRIRVQKSLFLSTSVMGIKMVWISGIQTIFLVVIIIVIVTHSMLTGISCILLLHCKVF